MTSIIQNVAYTKEDSKQLLDKFGELIGIHKLKITLKDEITIEGIISEVGSDYIIVIEGSFDTIIPLAKILYCRYER